MKLDHLSYSSISSYLLCGAAWKFKYVDMAKAPTATNLVFGSAFHGTIEQFLSERAQPTTDKPKTLIELWGGNWKEQLEKNPEIAWGDDTPEKLQNDGARILAHPDIVQGVLSIRPGIDSQGPKIERKIELRVPGVPIPIIGYIDVIAEDGVPGDFKTSSRAWTADQANGELQPLFYLAALNQANQTVKDWKFRHYVFVKTKTPQFQIWEHQHNPAQLMFLFKMVAGIWRAIEAGSFPENPTGWKCSERYCEYWPVCRGKYGN